MKARNLNTLNSSCEVRKRQNETTYIRKEDAPEWVENLVLGVHREMGFSLPNDMIYSILGNLDWTEFEEDQEDHDDVIMSAADYLAGSFDYWDKRMVMESFEHYVDERIAEGAETVNRASRCAYFEIIREVITCALPLIPEDENEAAE